MIAPTAYFFKKFLQRLIKSSNKSTCVRMSKAVKSRKRSAYFQQDDKNDTSNVKVGKKIPSSLSAPLQSQAVVPCHSQNGVAPRLGRAFFDVPCVTLARNLLGKNIVRSFGEKKIVGQIVETEAYMGPDDKAAHSYQGKKTPRNEAMFMIPGTCYVYNIYGMYCCLNISSQGDGSAVLIRALEPNAGQDLMIKNRGNKKTMENKKPLKEKQLTNGPSKLCQALYITKGDNNKEDLTTSNSLWLEDGKRVNDNNIVSCARINIGYAEDWTEKPLRFYIMGNSCVSIRNKKAEIDLKAEPLPSDEKVDNT